MHRFSLFFGFACFAASLPAVAQPLLYTVANAHSHNDYENPVPFHTAYDAGYGSIEADIFLEKNELIVAHDAKELRLHRSLQQLYLEPLISAVQSNRGFAYPDTTRQLQMLIDIKTAPIPTLNKFVEMIRKFPALANNRSIKWVISGNRPDEAIFTSYPSFIFFDGELNKNYSPQALTRIALMSDDFRNYSSWDGRTAIPPGDDKKLGEAIGKAHLLGKPVRFWDAPDLANAWTQLRRLGVDFINTDHIPELAKWLDKQ